MMQCHRLFLVSFFIKRFICKAQGSWKQSSTANSNCSNEKIEQRNSVYHWWKWFHDIKEWTLECNLVTVVQCWNHSRYYDFTDKTWKSHGQPILDVEWMLSEKFHYPILNDRIAYCRGMIDCEELIIFCIERNSKVVWALNHPEKIVEI